MWFWFLLISLRQWFFFYIPAWIKLIRISTPRFTERFQTFLCLFVFVFHVKTRTSGSAHVSLGSFTTLCITLRQNKPNCPNTITLLVRKSQRPIQLRINENTAEITTWQKHQNPTLDQIWKLFNTIQTEKSNYMRTFRFNRFNRGHYFSFLDTFEQTSFHGLFHRKILHRAFYVSFIQLLPQEVWDYRPL